MNLAIFGATARSANEEAVQEQVQARLARDLPAERRELPAIIASSRLDPKKNHLALVRAFAQHPALQEQANLVIFTGALADPLRVNAEASLTEIEVLASIRAVVEEYDLWGKISAFELRGQPSLAAAYRYLARRGSVFALTALYEPFGLAPLEAAAAGLPVIVTQNGGPSESLVDAETEYGVLVEPTELADIARGLTRVLGDAESWAGFAARGRQRVLDNYTWERTAAGYLVRMEKLLAAPAASRPAGRLPIHPYFRVPTAENAITLAELAQLYFGKSAV